jgi:GT2 family glycosyltransferase
MRGDVALAGIVFSAEDWAAYEPMFRAELLAAASTSSDPWVVSPVTGVLSGPIRMPQSDDR